MKRTLQMCALALIGVTMFAVRTEAQTITISNLWSIATSEARTYLTNSTGNSYWERGVAYNPLNNHAYIVSRFAPLKVAILDGDTGAELGFLNLTGVYPGGTPNGTFALSTIAVADDGAIYAANLTVSIANGPYRVYRWTNEVDPPVLVYSANPSADRYGETFDVRGSGTNTEIIASATAVPTITLLKPADDALTVFTNRTMPITGFVGSSTQLRGIAFGPTNTFYIKNYNSSSVNFCSYDLSAGSASTLTAHAVAARTGPIGVDPVNGILAGVETSTSTNPPHNLLVYDLSSSPPAQLFITAFPPPAATNGNVVGQVQISGDRIFAIDTQNGVVMAKINIDTNPIPPTISQHPGNQTVVLGGYTTLSAAATGTKPLSYQWFLDGTNAITGATNSSVRMTNVTFADAGAYNVRVTNIAGETNSNAATLTVSPTTLSLVLTRCWALPAGTTNFPYLTADNNQRGLAYNAVYNHLLLVSRAPTNAIHVFDATTGAYLHSLDLAGISGGTFALNMIACAEDGQVVVANLTINGSTDPFKVYVFPDSLGGAGNTALLAWSGNPGDAGSGDANRWGDNLAVRGTGLGLEVLVGSRTGRRIVILNGLFLALPPIVVDVPDAEPGNFGLSIAWGEGDTCWGKSSGTALRHVAFDVNAHLGTVLRTITNYPTMTVIAVDNANQLLAGNTLETPDTLRLLNISPALSTPLELDTEFFLSDNANANGTGQIVFGSGKLFALDSNNGIIALSVWPRLRHSVSGSMLTLTWDGTHTLQATPELPYPFTNVVGAVSGHTVNIAATGNLFYRLKD